MLFEDLDDRVAERDGAERVPKRGGCESNKIKNVLRHIVVFIEYGRQIGLGKGALTPSKKPNLHPCIFAAKLSYKCLL